MSQNSPHPLMLARSSAQHITRDTALNSASVTTARSTPHTKFHPASKRARFWQFALILHH
jgi:hypothetical protein